MSATRGSSRKGFSIRKHPNGNFSIAVPTHIGKLVPEGTVFRFEWTEEGILLCPVGQDPPLPQWIRKEKS